jgi:hypothetical protein
VSVRLMLTEDEALELLAYLVIAARTQPDEAAECGPLRLLAAVTRLADMTAEHASPERLAVLTGPSGRSQRWRPGRPIRSPTPSASTRSAGRSLAAVDTITRSGPALRR